MDITFSIEASNEAIGKNRTHEKFNADKGSHFTSAKFTRVLKLNEIKICMNGKGYWANNAFIERLWRSLKYEENHLKAYDTTKEARTDIGDRIKF